ncbi:MAG TPA: CDP-alcohol phosphatidyltransferase family protein [Puia sp.]|nr:CDP-alcohol phosphatidyltransferase family protein [Puia sp.]
MAKRAYYLINGVTLYRLFSAPLLVLMIVYDRPDVFKWLLAVSFLTDAVDGFLARKYKVGSVFGARLDSIADDLTILAAVVGMIAFKKEFLKEEFVLFIFLLALYLFQTILAFIKYRKMTSFHTYGAKVAAVLQGVFLLLLFFLPQPVYILFYLAMIATGAELVEEIILVFLLREWTADVKGLYWVLRKKKSR